MRALRWSSSACLVVMTGAGPATAPSAELPRLRVARLLERREADVPPSDSPAAGTALLVAFQVAGLTEPATVTGYGRWRVDVAEDDQGTDCRPARLPYADLAGSTARAEAERFEVVTATSARALLPGADEFSDGTISLNLAEPARSARVLRRLAGQVEIRSGGTDHVGRFDLPTGRIGQTFTDDALRAAGVSVTFEPPDRDDGGTKPTTLAFHVHGPRELVDGHVLDVVGADGKSVVKSWGNSGPSAEAEHRRTYRLSRPLDDRMSITLTVRLGQRTTTVPFDFANVPLP